MRRKQQPCGSKEQHFPCTQAITFLPKITSLASLSSWRSEPECMASVMTCFIAQVEFWRDIWEQVFLYILNDCEVSGFTT